MIRKIVASALLGLGMLVVTAPSASAATWYYTGYWYNSAAACERGYQELVGGNPGGVDRPHQCRYNPVGVYELWRMR